MNDFLNAEQRVRLACVLQHRKKWGSYVTHDFFMSANEILFVLGEDMSSGSFNHFVNNIINNKIAPLLKFKGYDGSEFSQEGHRG